MNVTTNNPYDLIQGEELQYKWNPGFVFLSIVFAYFGSVASLYIIKERTGLYGKRNLLHLLTGSIALSTLAIWNMHFVSFLKLFITSNSNKEIPITFTPGLTTGSYFIAFIFVIIGFYITGDPNAPNLPKILFAGLLVGLAVICMHYSAILAINIPYIEVIWNKWSYFIGSVIVAILAAIVTFIIFFKFSHKYRQQWSFMVLIPLLMATCICTMHYLGTLHITYVVNLNKINNNNLIDSNNIAIPIILFSILTCIGMIIYIKIGKRQLLTEEQRKAEALTLSILIIHPDEDRILTTLVNTLPSEVIDQKYLGQGVFNQRNPDFIRFFKTGFMWKKMDILLEHYKKHTYSTLEHSNSLEINKHGILKGKELYLYQNFVNATKKLANKLNLDHTQLGIIYWSPINNNSNVLIILKLNDSSQFINFKWTSRSSFKNNDDNQDHYIMLDEFIQYHKKVLMRFYGGENKDILNEYLYEVLEELIPNQLQSYYNIQVTYLRKKFGPFINTPQDLLKLFTWLKEEKQWSHLDLDLMLKTHLTNKLLKSNHDDFKCTGEIPRSSFLLQKIDDIKSTGEIPRRSPSPLQNKIENNIYTPQKLLHRRSSKHILPINNASIKNNLWLGLLYARFTSADLGIDIMIPANGPYSMIPMVPFSQAVTLEPVYLRWLQHMTAIELDLNFVDHFDFYLKQVPNESNILNDEEQLQPFISNFYRTCHALGRLVGTNLDLTPKNLSGIQVLNLTEDCNVLLFIVSRFENDTNFNTKYDVKNLQFIPKSIFDIIHYRQLPKDTLLWTNSILAQNVEISKLNLSNSKLRRSYDHIINMKDSPIGRKFKIKSGATFKEITQIIDSESGEGKKNTENIEDLNNVTKESIFMLSQPQ
jgi:NO-binding membrane sensor protein with MHYT domain